jgi:hypothetical protein
MGRFGLYVKISLLVLTLVAVFFIIRSLNTEKVEGAFQALGIQDSASAGGDTNSAEIAAETPLEETERTLCQTRVHAIRFANGDAVLEKRQGLKLEWVAEPAENAGTPRGLNYLVVEKWFSKHCKFKARAASPLENPEPSNEPVKYVLIEFIDNTTWEIYREGDAFLSASDPQDRFTSDDLQQAFEELRSIAGFAVDSKDR